MINFRCFLKHFLNGEMSERGAFWCCLPEVPIGSFYYINGLWTTTACQQPPLFWGPTVGCCTQVWLYFLSNSFCTQGDVYAIIYSIFLEIPNLHTIMTEVLCHSLSLEYWSPVSRRPQLVFRGLTTRHVSFEKTN